QPRGAANGGGPRSQQGERRLSVECRQPPVQSRPVPRPCRRRLQLPAPRRPRASQRARLGVALRAAGPPVGAVLRSLTHRVEPRMRLVRMIEIAALLMAVAAATLASTSYAADPSARAFLESIYRTYEKSEKAVDIASEAKAARYFVPS